MPHLLAANQKIAIDLTFTGAVSVGRHIANTLPLPDPEVSRYHAQIFLRDDRFIISDLASRNGIYVNGRRQQEQMLMPGDEICLGNTVLTFDPPRDMEQTLHFSEYGTRIWKSLPEPLHYVPAEVTTYAPAELGSMISHWLDHPEKTPLLSGKLRSEFLKFALESDRYRTKSALCEGALEFLENRIGTQRCVIFHLDEAHKRFQVLARYVAEEVPVKNQDFLPPKDILRIALDAGKAGYCPDIASDFRFEELYAAQQEADYPIQSFVILPIPGVASTFLYLDQSDPAESYDFKDFLQTYILGALLGKALHWYQLGEDKRKV
jgi:hypothetical protein